MNVRLESLGLITFVIPEGRLDFSAAAGFQVQVEQVLAGARTTGAGVIIDCAGLDYVSSAGLRVFLLGARAAQRTGLSFGICALKPAVREVFDLSGFSRIISVHADRATALAGSARKTSVNERRLAVPGAAAQLPVLTQFLQEFWSIAGLPPAEAHSFELALEEIFMNVVMHGSPADKQARVEVTLALEDGGLALTVEDDGPPFDPLSLPPPNLTGNLAERPVGGLGVFLVRQMMDTVSYTRVGGRNRLRVTRRLAH